MEDNSRIEVLELILKEIEDLRFKVRERRKEHVILSTLKEEIEIDALINIFEKIKEI